MINVIYTAIFYDKEDVLKIFPPVHENIFSHHSTIQFKPDNIDDLEIGKTVRTKIIGRLTNEKVDCLLVDNPYSKNKYPHITLSTAENIKPFQSNIELENNQSNIKYIDNLYLKGVIGYFNGNDIIKENINLLINLINEEYDYILDDIKKKKEILNNLNIGDKWPLKATPAKYRAFYKNIKDLIHKHKTEKNPHKKTKTYREKTIKFHDKLKMDIYEYASKFRLNNKSIIISKPDYKLK